MERSAEQPLKPTSPVPAAGSVPVRVRYCECDPMGVAHHAAYIPWLEVARTELLRSAGVTYAQLEAAGTFLVVAAIELKYRRPVYYDDVVEVRTRVVGGSRVKIRHEYEVALAEDGRHGRGGGGGRSPGEVLTVGSSTLVCVDADGRVRALPEWLAPGA